MKYFIVIILILLASLLDRKLLESFTNCKKNKDKLNTNTLRIPPVASNWNSKIIVNLKLYNFIHYYYQCYFSNCFLYHTTLLYY